MSEQMNLTKAEPLLSKEEFIMMINWINARWVNNPVYTKENLKRYYDDFKHFSPDTNWTALQDMYDEGRKFVFTPSEWKKKCTDLMIGWGGRNNDTPKGAIESGIKGNRDGLQRYLKENGYESFRHAVYMTLQKKQKMGQLPSYQKDNDYSAPWEEAKEWFTFALGTGEKL